MPLDGLTLHFMAQELNEKLAGGRVDRVMQPEKDTLILLLRAGNEKIITPISAFVRANNGPTGCRGKRGNA